jgi:uncharacterized membrane protein YsdA (DUF1294 family)
MLGWDQYRFDKKRARTRNAKLVYLHPVGSAGDIVHSGLSGHETKMLYFSCLGGCDTQGVL